MSTFALNIIGSQLDFTGRVVRITHEKTKHYTRTYSLPTHIVVHASSGFNPSESISVPRRCTLREFSEGGNAEAVVSVHQNQERTIHEKNIIGLLLASAEATEQAMDFETISGRLAMIGFAAALSVEFLTGNSVFRGIDVESLGKVMVLCLAAAAGAAALAFGSKTKQHISEALACGCRKLLDSAVDNVIDGLLFDDPENSSFTDLLKK